METAKKILLFYKYTPISNPALMKEEHLRIASQLGLKGRIIIAPEGINATVQGDAAEIEIYRNYLAKAFSLADIHYKVSYDRRSVFPKLSVKVRKEIVSSHLGSDDLDPNRITGKYITSDELHDWFTSGKEFYIVDMRNDYEHKAGFFEGSLLMPFANFRDLPRALDELKGLKNKTILTVCTGGVRCEKASGFLVKHGFRHVYQLYGGIVTYMEKYPNHKFKGKLYVFDKRILLGFNTTAKEHEIVGHCEQCGAISENYVNCANSTCHRHYISCEKCNKRNPFCSEACAYANEMTVRPIINTKRISVMEAMET